MPGNFHISTHAYSDIVSKLTSEGLYTFDLSHRILHFSVGNVTDINYVKQTFVKDEPAINVLDKIQKIDSEKKVFEYYLQVSILLYINQRLCLLHL